ncbi:hypothetical protein L3X38_033310 [Prunus dulcis]|uniref:Uncharacterized protein n=1 Tax=Prunus dulcis TaxID=3755 RepID=A0AAD4VHC8_PRUDU|nr:hypothetical protein L3X38_033310 [Prunus dulcis]
MCFFYTGVYVSGTSRGRCRKLCVTFLAAGSFELIGVGSASQGVEDTLPTPLEMPDTCTGTTPHLPTVPVFGEITDGHCHIGDGHCQLGDASTKSAHVVYLSEKSLSWQDWENSFIAFKAFFDGSIKILLSIDKLLLLCHRFDGYATFQGAFVYSKKVAVLRKFMDRYGDFMEITGIISSFSGSAAFQALGLVLHGIDTMQLLDITYHRLLCWRDAICEAITLGFHVDQSPFGAPRILRNFRRTPQKHTFLGSSSIDAAAFSQRPTEGHPSDLI